MKGRDAGLARSAYWALGFIASKVAMSELLGLGHWVPDAEDVLKDFRMSAHLLPLLRELLSLDQLLLSDHVVYCVTLNTQAITHTVRDRPRPQSS